MPRIAKRLLSVTASVSLRLCFIAAGLWIVSAIHPTTFRWRLRPERTLFVVLERWNIGFAEQAATQQDASKGYACDTSTLGSEIVIGSGMGGGMPGFVLSREQMGLNGSACLFHTFVRLPSPTPDIAVLDGIHTVWLGYFRFRTMEIGWWALILGFGILPGLRLFVRCRRERKLIEIGHCANCGYDLRATPDRCPECGKVVSPPANFKLSTPRD
jgi:hypothetical protein